MIRFLLFFLVTPLFGQIQIDKAGDGWDLKIDSALSLIKKVDSEKYNFLDTTCSQVSFWISKFSSCEFESGKGRIYVSTKEFKLNSINNLACVLVHESLHLYFLKNKIVLDAKQEENYCYRYELELANKLPNPEPWLKNHILRQIENTQK